MPLVEDLYLTDQTQQVRSIKTDGVMKEDPSAPASEPSYLEKQTAQFSAFICQIED